MDDYGAATAPESRGSDVREPDWVPVRLDKFIALSLATFGVYQMVWFDRNWRAVRRREGSKIVPWARALFAPIFLYSFLRRVDGVRGPVGLTLAYWAILLAGGLERWGALSLLSFVVVLPAVMEINRMSGSGARRVPSHGWRVRSAALGVVGLPLVTMAALSPFMMQSSLVAGGELSGETREFLHAEGILEPAETIVYFYSGGMLSVEEQGVFASDLGVTTYLRDPFTDELTVNFMSYDEIGEIEQQPVRFSSERIQVTLRMSEDDWLTFQLPTTERQHRLFLDEVERRMSEAREPEVDVSG